MAAHDQPAPTLNRQRPHSDGHPPALYSAEATPISGHEDGHRHSHKLRTVDPPRRAQPAVWGRADDVLCGSQQWREEVATPETRAGHGLDRSGVRADVPFRARVPSAAGDVLTPGVCAPDHVSLLSAAPGQPYDVAAAAASPLSTMNRARASTSSKVSISVPDWLRRNSSPRHRPDRLATARPRCSAPDEHLYVVLGEVASACPQSAGQGHITGRQNPSRAADGDPCRSARIALASPRPPASVDDGCRIVIGYVDSYRGTDLRTRWPWR